MRSKKEITIAVIASLLMHMILLVVLYYKSDFGDKVSEPDEQIMMIDLKDPNMQIADIPPPKVEERPDKSRHIGMYDQKVTEETVADKFVRAPGRPERRGGEGIEKAKEKAKVKEIVSDKNGVKNLTEKRPQKRMEESSAGSVARMPEDFYPDYKRGGHTYVNVLKHPDVGYFVMMKRVLKLAWDPVSVLRRRSMANEISRGNIKVVLGLSISKTGELQELFVINSSGMDDYDQEAIRAIKVSSPFSAPPPKLMESDGVLRVMWTFIVYV